MRCSRARESSSAREFWADVVRFDVVLSVGCDAPNGRGTVGASRLQIAAHWADLHAGDDVPESRLPGTEHPVRLSGDGTPTVGDFTATELGCALRISSRPPRWNNRSHLRLLQLRYPADVFPYAAAVTRSIDIDHTIPYLDPDRGGPLAKPASATWDPRYAGIPG